MALGAYVRNLCGSRPRSVMTSVAIMTCRRCPILSLEKSFSMNTCLIFFKLIGRNAVIVHVNGIGVAFRARERRVGSKDGRIGVGLRKNSVGSVATRTNGDLLITLHKKFAMLAHGIFQHLIGGQVRIKFAHVAGIPVASGTKCGNIRPFGNTDVALCNIHSRFFWIFRVAAVAIRARQAALEVNVVFHIMRGLNQLFSHICQSQMASNARILGRLST